MSACLAVIFTLRLFRAHLLSYGQNPGILRIVRTMIWGGGKLGMGGA